MGENHFPQIPVALYGFVLLMAGIAYYLLSQALIRLHGRDSLLAQAVGKDRKGILSIVLYLAAIPLAFVSTWIAYGIYALVAAIWLVPDRRIESKLHADPSV
jgi:uncharacterized membrane protein